MFQKSSSPPILSQCFFSGDFSPIAVMSEVSYCYFHLGVHWASVIVDFKVKEIVYYDSKESGEIPTVRPPCLYNIR